MTDPCPPQVALPDAPGSGAPPPPESRTGLILGVVVGCLLLLCCGGIAGAWYYIDTAQDDRAGADGRPEGVIDYRRTDPGALSREHQEGAVDYAMTPPAGGRHHQQWQNCMGDVYTAPIDDGDAVHSLEHGAVWITYLPDLPTSNVAELAGKVRGKEFLMLSPYPGQPTRVSLQAWGYQLRLDTVDQRRIDAFIAAYRVTASLEPGAPCGGGSTATVG